ncbi:methionyl-tRNA formyltransferase [Paracoccus salipaludis]|uniref:Methionyl-tRNA formyltransferase n=1 Tax=Paracoccus salipaludis TaxID=2032623 RepID=A0A2A2GKJ3_9RHOB|nr:formyltransferase family protein [Paracoccus salipaludis]PAU97524.1 methionyl-tRNA formyltransferase [Paracoccus salipaludis]
MISVFVGAVEGSAQALAALCEAGHAPALVVTLPLERAGNHSDFADLGPLAARHGVPVHRSTRTSAPETQAAIRALSPDVILVIGWSQLVGPEFLAIPRLGVLGFHPAALPRMRGRAVIPWHILTGQRQGGATLFWIDEGTDSGPVAAQAVFPIDPDRTTARALYDRSVGAMLALLPPLMDRLARGERPATPQDHARATVCARRRPEDGIIDWRRPAAEIERLVRAVGPPYPGALTAGAGGPIAVTAARLHPREGYFIGLPGQVQDMDGNALTVMCGDGRCLDLTEWSGPAPRRHEMLGGARDGAA